MPRLSDSEYKEYKALIEKMKTGKMTEPEKRRLAELISKRGAQKNTGKGFKPGANHEQDYSWYSKFPVINYVQRIAWNYRPGQSIALLNSGGNGPEYDTYPSMWVLPYLPTIGHSVEGHSAINIIARAMFLQMHRKYRNMGSYEPADVGITLFVIANVFATVVWAERIYGVLTYYDSLNMTVPDVLYEALNLDPNSWDDMAAYRARLNLRILRLHSVCLPKGMAVVERQVAMNSLIFLDSKDNSRNPCMYMFNPTHYYKWDGTFQTGTSAVATLLDSKATGANGFIPDDVLGILDEQLDSLLLNQDVARITSDILAAYTKRDTDTGLENTSDLMFLNEMPEDYKVRPIYDEDWLLQIHNSCFISGTYSGSVNHPIISTTGRTGISGFGAGSIRIYQSNGEIINQLHISGYGANVYNTIYTHSGQTFFGGQSTTAPTTITAAGISSVALNTWKDNPTDEDSVEYTRLVHTVRGLVLSTTSGGTTYYAGFQSIENYGTEIIVDPYLVMRSPTFFTTSRQHICNSYVSYVLVDKFDWHPKVFGYGFSFINLTVGQYSSAMGQAIPLWDLDNCVFLHAEFLTPLQDACVLSEFTFPMVQAFFER